MKIFCVYWKKKISLDPRNWAITKICYFFPHELFTRCKNVRFNFFYHSKKCSTIINKITFKKIENLTKFYVRPSERVLAHSNVRKQLKYWNATVHCKRIYSTKRLRCFSTALLLIVNVFSSENVAGVLSTNEDELMERNF